MVTGGIIDKYVIQRAKRLSDVQIRVRGMAAVATASPLYIVDFGKVLLYDIFHCLCIPHSAVYSVLLK